MLSIILLTSEIAMKSQLDGQFKAVELAFAHDAAKIPFIEQLECWYSQALYESGEAKDPLRASLAARHEMLARFYRQPFPGHLYDILQHNTLKHLGIMWIWPMSTRVLRLGFIHISQPHRGFGYGPSAIRVLIERARAENYQTVCLNVFAHQRSNQKIYQTLGFKPTASATSEGQTYSRIELAYQIS